MTVKELIEELQTFDPDAIAILSIDPEGNGYSETHTIDSGIYAGGEFYSNIKEFTEYGSGIPQRCVSIWP